MKSLDQIVEIFEQERLAPAFHRGYNEGYDLALENVGETLIPFYGIDCTQHADNALKGELAALVGALVATSTQGFVSLSFIKKMHNDKGCISVTLHDAADAATREGITKALAKAGARLHSEPTCNVL